MSIPVGTHTLHAVGAAMAAKWLGDDSLTVAFVGDGATSEGDVHEAFNLAAVQQAPCVFFVQNNQWAISTPVTEQFHARSIAARAEGYGMPGVRVDGNDLVACLLVVEHAVARARAGDGPTLVEALTYRLGPHTTSDDPRRYRSDDDVARWEARDPLLRCRRFLEKVGHWDDEREEATAARTAELRARLRAGIVDADDPSPLELFDFVFETPTAELRAERDLLAEELHRGG
jgi:pyruvate dehydrogenase E1 component alpha subunit